MADVVRTAEAFLHDLFLCYELEEGLLVRRGINKGGS